MSIRLDRVRSTFHSTAVPFQFHPVLTFVSVCVGKDLRYLEEVPSFVFPWKLFGKVDIFGAYICLYLSLVLGD
jgi:hypothetical protein